MQMPVPVLEVRRLVQAEMRRQHRVLLASQRRLRFVAAPDVELALLVLAVGVERGVVTALGRLHLAHDPAGSLLGAARVQPLARDQPGVGEQRDERPVGVEHLLEVDRKSTRLNSSHITISYAVFCLKKKKKKTEKLHI